MHSNKCAVDTQDQINYMTLHCVRNLSFLPESLFLRFQHNWLDKDCNNNFFAGVVMSKHVKCKSDLACRNSHMQSTHRFQYLHLNKLKTEIRVRRVVQHLADLTE